MQQLTHIDLQEVRMFKLLRQWFLCDVMIIVLCIEEKEQKDETCVEGWESNVLHFHERICLCYILVRLNCSYFKGLPLDAAQISWTSNLKHCYWFPAGFWFTDFLKF
jgi:hypothetical protein